MLDKKQQIHHSLLYMLPMGLSALFPFVTIPIFTRILTPEDYGVLALALIYAIFMCGLINFGVLGVFDRNYFKYRDNREKLAQLLFSSLVFVMTNFVVFSCITYIYKGNISEFLTGSAQHGNLIMTTFAANFFYVTINNFFFTFLRNSEKAKSFTKYKIINFVLNFIISLFLVAYLRIGIIGIVMAQLITGFLLFLIFLHLILKELPFLLNKFILLECLKISYPLIPTFFVSVLSTQFDKYMIGLFVTVGSVGVYHIGKKISEMVFIFMNAIQNVFQPQVYQRMFSQNKDNSESIGRYLTPFLYISIFVALGTALFSEELLTVLTPETYHGAIPIISILSVYYGLFFFAKVPQIMFVKKTYIVSIFSIIGLILNVALNIPLIKLYGPIGAAGATLLVGIILGVTGFWVGQYYYKIYYEWNKVTWIMGTLFISATAIVSLNLLNAPYLWSFLIKITSMVVFIKLGINYGIISKENLREIISLFGFKKLSTV